MIRITSSSATPLAAALMLAGSLSAASPAIAQAVFAAPDRLDQGKVSFAAAERGNPILPGGTVIATGEDFRAGQAISLMYGATALPGGTVVADQAGKFETRLTIPVDAVAGNHAIVVISEAPYAATVATLKISPAIALSGAERFKIGRAAVTRGLYQSAYSAKAKALFVTSAVGRPPVRQSELLRLNADTLKIEARVTPPAAPPREGRDGQPQDGGVFAVYGVGVDDANGNVWVTNSRQNTVAVYRQADLSLVKQFDPGTVNHARDIVVDPALGKAYASATFAPEVVVFDAKGVAVTQKIAIKSGVRGEDFSAASVSIDPVAHRLYVVSNATNEVAVIDTRSDTVVHVFPVPGARSAIGVSHDPQTGEIYVAAQGSDNLVVLDGTTGAVLRDTPVGAGALNVVFDPVRRQAFVANRGASSIAVVDQSGKIAANLGPAPFANHVASNGKGAIYAVTKGNEGQDDVNSLWRITPAK